MSYDPRFYNPAAIRADIPIVARTASKVHPWNLIANYRKPITVMLRNRPRHINPTEGSINAEASHWNELADADKSWIVNDSIYLPDIQPTSYLFLKLRYVVAYYDPDFFYNSGANPFDTIAQLKDLESMVELAEDIQVTWEYQIDQLADGDSAWSDATSYATGSFIDVTKAWPAYLNREFPIINGLIFADGNEKDGLVYQQDLVLVTRSNYPIDWDDSETLPDQDYPIRIKLTPSVQTGDISYTGPGAERGPSELRIYLTGCAVNYYRI
jgi:hypothetical protein